MPCIVKLCDICECSLLGRDCIPQSNFLYDLLHIQAVTEWMMDPWNMEVCVCVYMHVCMCVDAGSIIK